MKIIRTRSLVFLALLCLGAVKGICQGKWNLLKDRDGIRISSRSSAKSSFNDVLVQLDLPGTAEEVVSMVMKVQDYQNWAYATKNSFPVQHSGDTSLIYYSEIVAPWPVSNRDLYAGISVHRDSLSKRVFIVCSGMPGYAASKNHLVRIPYSKGSWVLTDIAPNRVHLDYTIEVDPGGNVPAWVLNLFIARGPYETFSHMRTKLEQLRKS